MKQPERQIETNIGEQEFLKIITELKRKSQKDMFQVVPSRIYYYKHNFVTHLHQLSFQLYQKLKRQNPSPYMYYMNKDIPIVVGSSPESLLELKMDWFIPIQ